MQLLQVGVKPVPGRTSCDLQAVQETDFTTLY